MGYIGSWSFLKERLKRGRKNGRKEEMGEKGDQSLLSCIKDLLEIRIFVHIRASNSITILQTMLILILKLDLVRLRESKQLVLIHLAQKLQNPYLIPGLCGPILNCFPPFHAASEVRMRMK